MTLNSSNVKPGSNFLLNVESTLNSSVSILAIDQRALSLGSDYDITKDYVFDHELIKYDGLGNSFDASIPFWFYQYSYQKRFIDVGAVILTNAKQEVPCQSTSSIDVQSSSELSTEAIDSSVVSTTQAPSTLSQINPPEGINKRFYDTFLFKTILVTTPEDDKKIRGLEVLNETAPELSTSWIISGIALSNKFGLGVTTAPAQLNAFLYFYIDFTVPSSIKSGEIAILEILVVNLFEQNLTASVKFFNELEQFEFVRPFAYNWISVDKGQLQNIVIQNNSIYRLRIEILPRQIGNIELKISATSSIAGDLVERQLLVLPEGFPIYENHAEFVDVEECDKDGKKINFSCSVPPEVLNETVQVQASVSGDVLGPALANIQSLIRNPTGCGEQTMIGFAPNVLALDYLTITNQLTSSLNNTAKSYLESSYQRMLKYRHSDASFSAFGAADVNGSTWLTAYVVKYFRGARNYIDIDEQVIAKALEFIASKQEADGKFREDGIVFHKSLQSGTGNGVAFTAYIALVLQDNVQFYPQYAENIQRAIDYVHDSYDANDVYSLAIATYLFYHANDADKSTFFTQLSSHATKTSKFMYWKGQPTSVKTNSLDLEITAYGLLIHEQMPQLYPDGFKILQWLVSQQNSKGGFLSSQDTVVALHAISKFASKFSSVNTDLKVDLHPDSGSDLHTTVDSSNSLITQTFQLQKSVRKLDVAIKGKGFAMVQLSCSYYLNKTVESSKFKLSVTFGNESCDNKLILNVNASFISSNSMDKSNMAVFTIDFPSGFRFDSDTPLSSEIQVSFA